MDHSFINYFCNQTFVSETVDNPDHIDSEIKFCIFVDHFRNYEPKDIDDE